MSGDHNRVVFINRVYAPDRAATSRLLTDLTRHLAKLMPVVVACSRTTRSNDDLSNVKVYRAPFGRKQGTSLPRRLLADLLFVGFVIGFVLFRVRRDDVVVVKTDPPLIQLIVAACAVLRRYRYICWHQDLYPEVAIRLGLLSEHGFVARQLTRMRNWAIKRAWRNVVIGEQMGDYLAPVTNTITIPNWAINDASTMADDRDAVQQYRPPDSKNALVIGHCGNLGRAHPVAPLLALAREYRHSRSIRFLIGGGGFHYDLLKTLVDAEKAWSFLPFQPELNVPTLLAAIDIHLVILDTRLSSFIVPSKCVGVLAAGRPTIFVGDPDSAIATLLVNSGAAIAVAPDDEEGLVAAVRKLSKDANLRASMATAARRLYDQNFSRASCMQRWEETIAGAWPKDSISHSGGAS